MIRLRPATFDGKVTPGQHVRLRLDWTRASQTSGQHAKARVASNLRDPLGDPTEKGLGRLEKGVGRPEKGVSQPECYRVGSEMCQGRCELSGQAVSPRFLATSVAGVS
jgi:hypothetical protein